MLRFSLSSLILLLLIIPSPTTAASQLEILETVVAANEKAQPGLINYHVNVETSRIKQMMARLTKGIPPEVQPPPAPQIHKFWQRSGEGLVYASNTEAAPYVEKMMQQASSHLAIELNEMLVPAGKSKQREDLVKGAEITLSEVALTDKLIRRLEITFAEPTDLDQAFYLSGMRLPQKQVTKLHFDIDAEAGTVNEMSLVLENGLRLTLEVRYITVPGGALPERFRITSPDGSIDDLFEVKFTEVDGFVLPESMRRTINRPNLQDDLEVLFKNYRVNQPIPADIQDRLKGT